MFGGTTPETVTINSDGTNNIQAAKAISWAFYIKDSDLSDSIRENFEKNYEDYVNDFNDSSQYILIYPYMSTAISREASASFDHDLQLIAFGIVMIVCYSFYVLGELNTYRSHILVSFFGVLSVVFAYLEAIALGSYFGIEGSGVVNVVPFLLLGIGVDDMYVLIYSLQ